MDEVEEVGDVAGLGGKRHGKRLGAQAGVNRQGFADSAPVCRHWIGGEDGRDFAGRTSLQSPDHVVTRRPMLAQGWSSVARGATECALAGSEERAHRVDPNGAWCDPLRERDQCDLEAFRASAAGLGPGRGLPAGKL